MQAQVDNIPDPGKVPRFSAATLETYLSRRLGEAVTVTGIHRLGEAPGEDSIKSYGYGEPLKIECRSQSGCRVFVLETVAPGPFGHEHMSDRAQAMLLAHDTFSRLPRHVRSLDVGAFRRDGELISVGDCDEFFLLMEFLEGTEYSRDLASIRRRGFVDPEDRRRCDSLCDYLVAIHSLKKNDPGLYLRRLRELFGHSECLLGLTDSYSAADRVLMPTRLQEIEQKCLESRWHLKWRTHRLSQVHGDFHPWNILFDSDGKFRVLDRSRGEWGEPADDLIAMAINFVFSSLLKTEKVEGPFLELHERFWQRYLDLTGDREILQCVAPFVAFRGLVVASRLWYPKSSPAVREAIFNLIRNVLKAREFDPGKIQRYCEKSP